MKMKSKRQRRGSVAVLLCFLMLPLLALLALAVDYGFLLYIRTDLQRTADQASIAAVRDLVPDAYGNQDLNKVRATVREYVAKNLGDSFEVNDADIEIGRSDTSTIYGSLVILDSGIFDTVRVKLRRDDLANTSVSLYFARIFDRDSADLSAYATAILQRGRYLGPNTGVLPIAMEQMAWNDLGQGENAFIYGDGRIVDGTGSQIPGNWGTLDIGHAGNSVNELREQLINGLSQDDLNELHSQGAIPVTTHIDSQLNPLVLNGDTGFSAGMKHAVYEVYGQNRLMPIYESTTGQGGNLMFNVIGWGAVKIISSKWGGNKNSYIEVKKTYLYDQYLLPSNDLSNNADTIEGTFTSPALIE
jgi:hypothetical protein